MALYDAFVSYSHAKDKPIAAALQSVVQKLGQPWYRRYRIRDLNRPRHVIGFDSIGFRPWRLLRDRTRP
jgi:hypothetical protein